MSEGTTASGGGRNRTGEGPSSYRVPGGAEGNRRPRRVRRLCVAAGAGEGVVTAALEGIEKRLGEARVGDWLGNSPGKRRRSGRCQGESAAEAHGGAAAAT